MTDGTAISTREVFRELDRQEPDHILTWAKQNPTVFRTPTSDETKFVVEILAVPHFQQLIGAQAQLVGTPVADPFVIALAAVNKGAVVTEERFQPNAAKIPNVCQHFWKSFCAPPDGSSKPMGRLFYNWPGRCRQISRKTRSAGMSCTTPAATLRSRTPIAGSASGRWRSVVICRR